MTATPRKRALPKPPQKTKTVATTAPADAPEAERTMDDTTPETFSTSSVEHDDAAPDLDSFTVPPIDGDQADPDAPVDLGDDGEPVTSSGPEAVDKDQFWIVFQTAFGMPGMFLPDLRPMAIQPFEEAPARQASDATHSLLEIYYPSALMPQSETLAHLMAAMPFFLAKAMIVREIIRSRRARDVSQPRGDDGAGHGPENSERARSAPDQTAPPEQNGAGDTYMPPVNAWASDGMHEAEA